LRNAKLERRRCPNRREKGASAASIAAGTNSLSKSPQDVYLFVREDSPYKVKKFQKGNEKKRTTVKSQRERDIFRTFRSSVTGHVAVKKSWGYYIPGGGSKKRKPSATAENPKQQFKAHGRRSHRGRKTVAFKKDEKRSRKKKGGNVDNHE